jgi:hypothetical protein
MLMRSRSLIAPETVEGILGRLDKKKKEGNLGSLIRGQLQWAKSESENLPDLAHLRDIRNLAKSASTAIGRLTAELRRVRLLDSPLPFGSDLIRAQRAVDLWQNVWPINPRKDMRQYIAACCAVHIIETCSDDEPVKTSQGNVHIIAQLVYQEIFGSPPQKGKDHWLLSTCQEVIKQRQQYHQYLDWNPEPLTDKGHPTRPEWPSGIQFFPPKTSRR